MPDKHTTGRERALPTNDQIYDVMNAILDAGGQSRPETR